MKNDARHLLNKKKSGRNKLSQNFKSHKAIDARKILNFKRKQKVKPPTLVGNFMKTQTIASQIRKEITHTSTAPKKMIRVSKDGNIIITQNSKIHQQHSMQVEPSISDMRDLEHTTYDDVLDFDSLPPAFATSNSLQNLSRRSTVSQILEKRHTMVADELSEKNASSLSRVYVSNLHPTVSKEDVMELFGNVGVIRNIMLVRPGTALIEFYDENDAEKACDVYHNRLLDGLPMKCYLQSGSQEQRCTISKRLGERMVAHSSTAASSNLPAVPTNPRSRYNPRNVQFTVKLT